MLTDDSTQDALLRKWRQFTVKLPCLCSGCLWVMKHSKNYWSWRRQERRSTWGKMGWWCRSERDTDASKCGRRRPAPPDPSPVLSVETFVKFPWCQPKSTREGIRWREEPQAVIQLFVSALSLNLDYMLHLYVLGGIPKNTFWDHFWSPVTFLGYRVSKLQNQVLNPSTVACKSSSSDFASKDSADGWIESIWKNWKCQKI